jgi:hypothetical protein
MTAGALDRFFRPIGPAERLAALRILVGSFAGVYSIARAPSLAGVSRFARSEFVPTGVTHLLSSPLPTWAVQAMLVVTILSAIPFVLGLRFRITGPIFAAAFLWVTTYRNSFGFLFHTENLAALHVIVLAASDAAAVWSLDARRKEATVEPSPRFGWPVRLVSIVTVATYVLAGAAKLRMTGVDWISGDVLRHHIAYDNARKAALGGPYSHLGAALVQHAWAMKPLAFASVVLELGAPLALLGRRIAGVWALFAFGFHAGVSVLMAIVFPYPLLGVAFLSFFAPEKWLVHIGALFTRRAGRA